MAANCGDVTHCYCEFRCANPLPLVARYKQQPRFGAKRSHSRLLGQFFEKPNEELKVVYADTSFALWQDLNGENLNLGDYLNRNYMNVKGNKLFNVR